MGQMNICVGCIKQDTCKFKERVEDEYETWRNDTGRFILKEPLGITISCKYKQNGGCDFTVCNLPNSTTETVWAGLVPWDYTI